MMSEYEPRHESDGVIKGYEAVEMAQASLESHVETFIRHGLPHAEVGKQRLAINVPNIVVSPDGTQLTRAEITFGRGRRQEVFSARIKALYPVKLFRGIIPFEWNARMMFHPSSVRNPASQEPVMVLDTWDRVGSGPQKSFNEHGIHRGAKNVTHTVYGGKEPLTFDENLRLRRALSFMAAAAEYKLFSLTGVEHKPVEESNEYGFSSYGDAALFIAQYWQGEKPGNLLEALQGVTSNWNDIYKQAVKFAEEATSDDPAARAKLEAAKNYLWRDYQAGSGVQLLVEAERSSKSVGEIIEIREQLRLDPASIDGNALVIIAETDADPEIRSWATTELARRASEN